MSKTKAKAKAKGPTSREPIATMVSGAGTDNEIAERCAQHVPGWAKMGERGKADTIRLMRHHHEAKAIPAMNVSKGENGIGLQTPDGANATLNAMRLVEAMGVGSDAFLNARVQDLCRYHGSTGSGIDTLALSDALALIAGAGATDPVQSSLLTQMHCTHNAAIRALSAVGKSEWVDNAQMWGNLSVKLLNAYARQAEVLAKLQRGGEQVIKHVHIDNRGGQAVLAEQVITGGGGSEESRNQPLGLDAGSPALLGSDSLGRVVPLPSSQRPEAMPVARGSTGKRSAQG